MARGWRRPRSQGFDFGGADGFAAVAPSVAHIVDYRGHFGGAECVAEGWHFAAADNEHEGGVGSRARHHFAAVEGRIDIGDALAADLVAFGAIVQEQALSVGCGGPVQIGAGAAGGGEEGGKHRWPSGEFESHAAHCNCGGRRKQSSGYAGESMLIEVAQARLRVGRRALLEIDRFAVAAGQHWCVFGPNGAGKSLLAELIRARRRESGNYVSYAEGFDPARDILPVSFEEQQRLWRRDAKLDIGDFCEDAQDRGTTVGALIHAALPAAEQRETLLVELAAELELTPLLDKGIRFLSSGQIRRVLIARALYGQYGERPKLLIFDEPLESLDRDSRAPIATVIAGRLRPTCASLHLCRRARDRFAAATHLLVMEQLRVLEQDVFSEVVWHRAVRRFRPRSDVAVGEIPQWRDAPRNPPGAETKLIELRGVDAAYGELRVLRDVHWTMTGRHHVLIEGPNGCGKSTLLSLIDGENHKGYGQEVYLFGRRKGSGETVWDVRRHFGVVSNELHNRYVRGWKVLDVVVSGFFDSVGLYDDSGGGEHEHARAWLETLRIRDAADACYHQLSFGRQRLVLLARAMVKQPDILILDEPCVGLDDFHRDFILRALDAIAEQTPARLIYVSHAPGEQPACVNHRLRFEAAESGGFRLTQGEIQPAAFNR